MRRVDNPEETYIHDEAYVRSELVELTKALAKARLSFAFIPTPDTKNEWTVRVPRSQENALLRALKDADL